LNRYAESRGFRHPRAARAALCGALTAAVLLALSGCPVALPEPPTPLSPEDGAVVLGAAVTLSAELPESAGGEQEVTFWGRAVEAPGEDFTIIALPDTQFYSESYPETFRAQTQWIIDQRETLNIAAVLHLGDIVDEADDRAQWQAADEALAVLESQPDLPVGLTVGNHDQHPNGQPAGTQNFNAFFPVERFADRAWYGGHFGDDNDNSFVLFSAGGIDFIAVLLEFDRAANAEVLAWADEVLKAHADRKAIIVTHFMLASHLLGSQFSSQGQAIRDALTDNPNVFLLLGGHFCETGRRSDNIEGRRVVSILSDYQCRPNGGDGWLRILHFSPANNTLRVQTYSPTRDEYLDGPRHEFALPVDLRQEPEFELLARLAADPQASVEFLWTGLALDTTYEWFVSVTAEGVTTQSPRQRFRTPPG